MRIDGLGDTLGALNGWKDAGPLGEAIEAGTKVIEAGARQRCQSSEVADTILVRPINSKKEGYVAWNTVVRHPRGAIEEFGSGPREGQRGPHNFPARPYLRPTADEDQTLIDAEVKAVLGGKFDTKLRRNR